MAKQLMKEVGWVAATIVAALTVVFFLIHMSPIGPCDTFAKMSPEAKAECIRHLGLDKPLWYQYGLYWWRFVHGDLGESSHTQGKEIIDMIREALPVTLTLGIPAILIAGLLGLATGVFAAARHNRPGDYTVMGIAMFGISVPEIVIAPVVILVFAVWLNWLPAQGWGTAKHMVLPVITLSLYYYAVLSRLTRGGMLEALQRDYVMTARAKGASEIRVIVVHALQGGISQSVTYLAVAIVSILSSGAVIVERIFNIPGVARLFLDAAMKQDILLLLGTTFVSAVMIVCANKTVDGVYVLLDPRLRRKI